jgi:hypothetical protein
VRDQILVRAKERAMVALRGHAWEFDAGPAAGSGWAELFAETPNYRSRRKRLPAESRGSPDACTRRRTSSPRRGHYELGVDAHPELRIAAAFTELAHPI